jgi:serine/threonine protein kinase
MVFERLGLSLYDLVKRNDYKRLPLSVVKSVSRQLLEGLEFLQSINLIHTGMPHCFLLLCFLTFFLDLKLENVLFVHNTLITQQVEQDNKTHDILVPQNTRIKCMCWYSVFLFLFCVVCLVIDFGGGTYDDEDDKATIINTRQYRGPEVTLEVGWSFPSDIWSAACIIGEVRSLILFSLMCYLSRSFCRSIMAIFSFRL